MVQSVAVEVKLRFAIMESLQLRLLPCLLASDSVVAPCDTGFLPSGSLSLRLSDLAHI